MVLTIVLIALSGFGVWAVVVLVGTLQAARGLAEDLDRKLVPLIQDVRVTVDAVNAELRRVDGLVTQLEEVTDAVEATRDKVADVGGRVRRIVSVLAGRRM